MSKLIIRTVPLVVLLILAGASQASAQGFSAYFGMGSAIDNSATAPGCPASQVGDPNSFTIPPCVPASGMGGVFGVFGADFMFKPHLGVNGEYSFRFAQANYLTSTALGFSVPFNERPGFYDFNLIYQPGSADSRIVPLVEGGIGGTTVSFYQAQNGGSLGNTSQLITSANHFQVHAAAGVKLYFKTNIFIKPQVDIHYSPNLTTQFGRNLVPEITVSIGYTFGRS